MFRRILTITGLPALIMLVSLLVSSPAAAQNQGYSVWAHRNDGGGYSGSYYSWPTYGPAYAPPATVYGGPYYSSPTYGPAYAPPVTVYGGTYYNSPTYGPAYAPPVTVYGGTYYNSPTYGPAYATPVTVYGGTYHTSPDYRPAYATPVTVHSDQDTESYYTSVSPSSGPVSEQTVMINVSLPSSAEIWFNNAPTAQMGPSAASCRRR